MKKQILSYAIIVSKDYENTSKATVINDDSVSKHCIVYYADGSKEAVASTSHLKSLIKSSINTKEEFNKIKQQSMVFFPSSIGYGDKEEEYQQLAKEKIEQLKQAGVKNINVHGTLPPKTAVEAQASADGEEENYEQGMAASPEEPGYILNAEKSGRFQHVKDWAIRNKKPLRRAVAIAATAAVAFGLYHGVKALGNARTAQPTPTPTPISTVDPSATLSADEQAYLDHKEDFLIQSGKIIDNLPESITVGNETIEITGEFRESLKTSGAEYDAAYLKFSSWTERFQNKLDYNTLTDIRQRIDSFHQKALIMMAYATEADENLWDNFFVVKSDATEQEKEQTRNAQEAARTLMRNLRNKDLTEEQAWNNIKDMLDSNKCGNQMQYFATLSMEAYAQANKLSEDYLNSQGYSSYKIEAQETDQKKLDRYNELKEKYIMVQELEDELCNGMIFDPAFAGIVDPTKDLTNLFNEENQKLNEKYNYKLIIKEDGSRSKTDFILTEYNIRSKGMDAKKFGIGGSGLSGGPSTRVEQNTYTGSREQAMAVDPEGTIAGEAAVDAAINQGNEDRKQQVIDSYPGQIDPGSVTEGAPPAVDENPVLVDKEEGETVLDPNAPAFDGGTWHEDPVTGEKVTEDEDHKAPPIESNKDLAEKSQNAGPEWNSDNGNSGTSPAPEQPTEPSNPPSTGDGDVKPETPPDLSDGGIVGVEPESVVIEETPVEQAAPAPTEQASIAEVDPDAWVEAQLAAMEAPVEEAEVQKSL